MRNATSFCLFLAVMWRTERRGMGHRMEGRELGHKAPGDRGQGEERFQRCGQVEYSEMTLVKGRH